MFKSEMKYDTYPVMLIG